MPSEPPPVVPRSGDPPELVQAVHGAGAHVREIPDTGLIRVSCGWWTSDDDLERLLAALAT